MEFQEYRWMFENEDKNFFYVANHKIIISLIKRFAPTSNKPLKILEAGCGTGLLSKKLKPYGKVNAFDIHPEAIRLTKQRGVNARKGSVNNVPFHTNSFDVVTSVDVIYHKQVDDQKALSEFFRVLKPGGILVVRVPANKWLVRESDKHVHTRERYNKEELARKLQKAGFIIEKISYINSLLLPPVIITHYLEKIIKPKSTKSQITPTPKLINLLLSFLLSSEAYILQFLNLPFGLGIVAVTKKPKSQSTRE